MLEIPDGVNLLGIGLEIIGFIFLLSFIKNRFLHKKLSIRSEIDSDESEQLDKRFDDEITDEQLMEFYIDKMEKAKINKYEISDFRNRYDLFGGLTAYAGNMSRDYCTLMANKKFSYVEWGAIGLIIAGLCGQGLSVFLEKCNPSC